jgi:hypothetical protein
MRFSPLLVALSAGAVANASMIPRDSNCNGEVYNGYFPFLDALAARN